MKNLRLVFSTLLLLIAFNTLAQQRPTEEIIKNFIIKEDLKEAPKSADDSPFFQFYELKELVVSDSNNTLAIKSQSLDLKFSYKTTSTVIDLEDPNNETLTHVYEIDGFSNDGFRLSIEYKVLKDNMLLMQSMSFFGMRNTYILYLDGIYG